MRSAEKEAAVLDLVRGDPRYMNGRSVRDERGNLVRVIDVIEGETFLSRILGLPLSHEAYIESVFPGVLAAIAESLLAIERLHRSGLTHGDIRNDHIFVEAGSARLRWIDFDLDQDTPAYDVWSVGNLLHCVVAKGFITFQDAFEQRPELATALQEGDASVFFPFRVMNLGKVFPLHSGCALPGSRALCRLWDGSLRSRRPGGGGPWRVRIVPPAARGHNVVSGVKAPSLPVAQGNTLRQADAVRLGMKANRLVALREVAASDHRGSVSQTSDWKFELSLIRSALLKA